MRSPLGARYAGAPPRGILPARHRAHGALSLGAGCEHLGTAHRTLAMDEDEASASARSTPASLLERQQRRRRYRVPRVAAQAMLGPIGRQSIPAFRGGQRPPSSTPPTTAQPLPDHPSTPTNARRPNPRPPSVPSHPLLHAPESPRRPAPISNASATFARPAFRDPIPKPQPADRATPRRRATFLIVTHRGRSSRAPAAVRDP
jgi:hypothetical protein